MKTVVFAYHNMGLTGLDALARHDYDIAAVFTHEDDPDEKCWFGSVRKLGDTEKHYGTYNRRNQFTSVDCKNSGH